jgi:hypothetical protein
MQVRLYEDIERQGGRVTFHVNRPWKGDLVRDDLFVLYEDADAVERLNPSLLAMPAMLNLAPVVWLSGREARVEVLDRELAHSLERVRSVFADLYPDTSWEGRVVPERLVDNRDQGSPGARELALLFSGGVDSVYTSLSLLPARQLLVAVRGADVPLDNDAAWDAVRRQIERFADDHGHEVSYIESNFGSFLARDRLAEAAPDVSEWWGQVQHGLGFVGLAAPLVTARRLARLVIAATLSLDWLYPWGSHPAIEPELRWAGTGVEHHGAGVTRQGKIAFIARATSSGERRPPLRVCWQRPDLDGRNCCLCEKCLRTISGLLVEGEEPGEYGFDLPLDTVLTHALARVRRRKLEIDTVGQARRWEEIQRAAQPERSLPARFRSEPFATYLRWLRTECFPAYLRKRNRRRRLLSAVSQRLPRTYRLARHAVGR